MIVMILLTTVFNKFKMKMDIFEINIKKQRNRKVFLWI